MDMAAAKTMTALARAGHELPVNSITEMMQLAEILFKGGAATLPNVDRPEKVFHLLLHGREIGLTWAQSLAGLNLGKNGKITIGGDAALALVLQSGLLEDIKEFWEGEDATRKGVCVVKRKGFPDPRRFEFTTAQAETAGLIKRAKGDKGDGPWLAYRDRMLRYRPLGYALRDVFPDVLKGLYLTEEVADGSGGSDPNVVNTQVTVRGTTADPPKQLPASQAVAPVATPPAEQQASEPVAPASSGPLADAVDTFLNPDGPVTDAQKNEFVQIRAAVMAAKGISDKNAQKAEWEQVLAPHGVSSVGQLTAATAAKVLLDLGPKHIGPFSDPAGSTSTT